MSQPGKKKGDKKKRPEEMQACQPWMNTPGQFEESPDGFPIDSVELLQLKIALEAFRKGRNRNQPPS